MTDLKCYLTAIRQVTDAATTGPWEQHGMKWNSVMREYNAKLTSGEAPSDSKYSRPITVGYLQLNDSDYRPYDKDCQEELPMQANAEFIAISREAIPTLLSLVETLHSALDIILKKIPDDNNAIHNGWDAMRRAEIIVKGNKQ